MVGRARFERATIALKVSRTEKTTTPLNKQSLLNQQFNSIVLLSVITIFYPFLQLIAPPVRHGCIIQTQKQSGLEGATNTNKALPINLTDGLSNG